MTEEQAKQFEKRPPAQYRRPDFYFRGGDVLREQEYLHDEYKKTLGEYRIAVQHLHQVQDEVQDATDVLAEREGYTNALASYLERDTEAATTEESKKKQLTFLEREIAVHEQQLKEIKACHNPAALAALQKEKAHYMIEIQKGNRAVQTNNEQRDEAKRQIAACTVNGRYRRTLDLEYNARKNEVKKNRLRNLVKNSKADFDSQKPRIPLTDQESNLQRTRFTSGTKVKMELLRTLERKDIRPDKHRNHILNLLDQIQELNDRMIEIGIEDDVVDIEEFRERVLNEDYSDDEEPFEEEEDTEISEPIVEEKPKPKPKPKPRQAVTQQKPQQQKPKEPSEPINEAAAVRARQLTQPPPAQEKDEEEKFDSDGKKSKSSSSSKKSHKSESDKKKLSEDNFDDEENEDKKEKEKSEDEKEEASEKKTSDDDFDDGSSEKKKSLSTTGGFDDDNTSKKSDSKKSESKKSESNDFEDDDDDKKSSGEKKEDSDEEKKSSEEKEDSDEEKKSSEEKEDSDEEKKTSEEKEDSDEEKKTSEEKEDSDEEKKTSEEKEDSDEEKKTSEEKSEKEDSDGEEKKSGSDDDDEEKKSTTENESDDKKKTGSGFDEEGFDDNFEE